jgi:hypothetical protein
MESFEMIKYKWENGIYDLTHMINLVIFEEISKEQFFEITRFNYDGVIATHFPEIKE